MAARPSSPTSLLWAHQLKREHGVLLKRMQDVEASSDRQSKRLKATETTSTDSIADIAALAQRVQALEDAGLEERLSNIENDIKGKVHDLKADSKALAVQIAAIQRDVEAHGQKTTLLERIGELEKGLETFERSVQQIGRRVEQAQLDSIKTQLEGLRRQVEAEGETMSMLSESVTALESAKDMLKASNERLAAELGAITRKNAATGTADVISAPNACAAATSISTSAPAPLESKKKSHKWNGGGADRDIIVSGLASSPIVPTTRGQRVKEMPSREREGPAPAKFRSEPKQKETSKTIPPHLRAEGSARPTAATTSSTSTGPRAAGRELGSSRARRVILQPPVAVGDLGG